MVTGHSQIPQACRMNVITYQRVVFEEIYYSLALTSISFNEMPLLVNKW